MNKRVGFVSLGCPKATYDSEQILTQLRSEGYDIAPSYEDADLVVVNTCGFIDDAVEESLQAIGEALSENGKVVVTGCLGAKGDLIEKAYPKVLAVSGPHATESVMQSIHEHLPPDHDPFADLVPPGGIKLTPRHYAYIKIAEGCNHRCSFCIIPSLRGDLVSRPVGDVLREAEDLVSAGVQELLIVSQDTSAYGVDTRFQTDSWQGRQIKTRFFDLAEALGDLGVWIRMHYVYPYPHVDDVIPLMADGKILPYLDVPLQHASPTILKSMKRPADAENALRRIEGWREMCPDISLRSTFIVGFPGETADDFNQLLDFMRDARLDRVGAFAYSAVDGAVANELANPVPEELKQQRLEQFMELQSEISFQKLAERTGQIETVIVDGYDDENILIARSMSDAPEIDGQVYVADVEGLSAGDFMTVEITDSDEHDLWAEPA